MVSEHVVQHEFIPPEKKMGPTTIVSLTQTTQEPCYLMTRFELT